MEEPESGATLDDIIEQAPDLKTPESKPETKPPPAKAEGVKEEQVTEPEEPVETTEKPPEETPTEKPAGEPSKPTTIKIGEKEYTEQQIQEFENAHVNKSTWQKNLTQKSQLAAKYSDDELRSIQARIKLDEELAKKTYDDLPESFEVKQKNELDEIETITIPGTKLKPYIDAAIEKAKNEWINEFAPQIAEAEKIKQEAEEKVTHASQQAGLTHTQQYFGEFPKAAFDLGEDPVTRLNEIYETGKDHPDYNKLLDLLAVQQRASAKGITLKEAHIELFGRADQIAKANDVIDKEQKAVQQEKAGKAGTSLDEDQKVLKSLDTTKGVSSVFE